MKSARSIFKTSASSGELITSAAARRRRYRVPPFVAFDARDAHASDLRRIEAVRAAAGTDVEVPDLHHAHASVTLGSRGAGALRSSAGSGKNARTASSSPRSWRALRRRPPPPPTARTPTSIGGCFSEPRRNRFRSRHVDQRPRQDVLSGVQRHVHAPATHLDLGRRPRFPPLAARPRARDARCPGRRPARRAPAIPASLPRSDIWPPDSG